MVILTWLKNLREKQEELREAAAAEDAASPAPNGDDSGLDSPSSEEDITQFPDVPSPLRG